jgi:hypothetical protein
MDEVLESQAADIGGWNGGKEAGDGEDAGGYGRRGRERGTREDVGANGSTGVVGETDVEGGFDGLAVVFLPGRWSGKKEREKEMRRRT